MIEIIFKSKADIIFFQEMTRKQYDDISNSIDCIFNCIGIYRDKSKSSEKISIAYNKNKGIYVSDHFPLYSEFQIA